MNQDYRQILKEKLSDRCNKNPQYSLRAFARDLGISPQRLSHILNGNHGLSVKAAEEISKNLGMNQEETTLFCVLVQKKHARSKIVRTEADDKLKDIKATYQDLSLDHFRIIADWYHFAIMELTLVDGFKSDPRWIARSLDIKEIEAKLAIERLLKLEMLVKDKKGNLKLTGSFFADPRGVPSEALRNFHRQLLKKATDALDTQRLDERDVSSTILAIDKTLVPEAKADLKKFRENFDKKYSNSENKNKVYCLGIQFFNLQKNEQ